MDENKKIINVVKVIQNTSLQSWQLNSIEKFGNFFAKIPQSFVGLRLVESVLLISKYVNDEKEMKEKYLNDGEEKKKKMCELCERDEKKK